MPRRCFAVQKRASALLGGFAYRCLGGVSLCAGGVSLCRSGVSLCLGGVSLCPGAVENEDSYKVAYGGGCILRNCRLFRPERLKMMTVMGSLMAADDF